MEREDAEFLISAGHSFELTENDLKQVRFCRTPEPNSKCQYNLFGCRCCPEYLKTKKKD